ncbi:MAG: Rieske (2Fe-2S) protein [Actinobacteria bacterium]|nr:Rieske (2Fe-2S) protein [Actinomycetota bacterium]
MVERRTVLQVSGVLAVGGVLAACGGGAGSEPSGAAAGAASEAAGASGEGAAIALVGDVPVGGGVVNDEVAIVVTQPSDGSIKAFTAVCPHQGCLVSEVVDNEIICPCHDSRFSAVDGAVLQGPATEGLAAASVVVQGDSIVLA